MNWHLPSSKAMNLSSIRASKSGLWDDGIASEVEENWGWVDPAVLVSVEVNLPLVVLRRASWSRDSLWSLDRMASTCGGAKMGDGEAMLVSTGRRDGLGCCNK